MSIRTVKDLYTRRNDQNKLSHEVYRSILRDVYTIIEDRDNTGKRNAMYRVPFIVYGNSRYKMSTAVHYLIRKLSEGGFVVFPYDQNLLYIDWSIVVVKTPPPQQPLLKPCLKR
jgi:hypothetical protein